MSVELTYNDAFIAKDLIQDAGDLSNPFVAALYQRLQDSCYPVPCEVWLWTAVEGWIIDNIPSAKPSKIRSEDTGGHFSIKILFDKDTKDSDWAGKELVEPLLKAFSEATANMSPQIYYTIDMVPLDNKYEVWLTLFFESR